MPTSVVDDPETAAESPNPLRSRWGMALIPIAGVVVIVGAVFGIRGLLANPVVSVSAGGVTTISGSFEPVTCSDGCIQGYVQAGARSVFVLLPSGCPQPSTDHQVTLTARRDPTLGGEAYRATGCASG